MREKPIAQHPETSLAASYLSDLTPPLKWAGGKRWLVPRLRTLWEGHQARRLVEPFVGGLAVALGIRPERALLNDVNKHLINFYRWLQKGLSIERQFRNEPAAFYEARLRFNELVSNHGSDSKEAAELFYYLNRTAYNGLCRFNSKGKFNVPFGRYKKISYADTGFFARYSVVLRCWEFSCEDYSRLKVDNTDFIYADPPYDVEFTKYSANGFTWREQQALAEWLASHRGPVVASNQATDRVLSLYKRLGFEVHVIPGPRRIACNGDRRPALEMLALRNVSPRGLF